MHTSSNSSQNTNLRCLNLEETCNNSIRSEEKYKDESKSPTYEIIDSNVFTDLFKNHLCNTCKNSSLRVVFGKAYGFCQDLKVVCDFCDKVINEVKTSKQLTKNENGQNQPFDINLRATQAFLSFGRGYTALKKIRSEVKKAYNEEKDGITNIAVTFDGTWLTRRHTSQIGIGCVIDMRTGYVIDYQVMSKYCKECELAKGELNKISAEYEIWYDGHKDYCNVNHCGSSGSMEVQAAFKLWLRSEKNGFRYTSVLSDGDSKAFQHLTETKVYCDIEIKKRRMRESREQAIWHRSSKLCERMAVKRSYSWWKISWSLKEETIKRLTQYYQNAILKNKGNADKMKTAIYATLYHSISTDKKPQHFKCPSGQESWCFYQAAIASGIKPGSHKELVKTPVNEAHLAKILPIYQRLASNELLERCIRCTTQNSNETLHSVIWSKCSKISSASMKGVNVAACEAISEFNIGTLKTLELLRNENNMQLNTSARNLALYKDYRRVYFRKRRRIMLYNLVQKNIKLARKRRENLIRKKEGITYKAGHF
ncbi:hypothetical protein AVEN_43447-1 [Araneus ventricosus]|uniref:Mutator-like transposase domain-containing protein n=1 Tax=Araneus ventricosus TaxID=182803 RepID=A0A4Y2JKK0_ARAVE|nr:hypothetical protein AVEN_43447-1 [Araneus ventricosus]